jgi:hypothetical protein
MNANTAWHWGKGDHDADVSDAEEETLRLEDKSSDVLQLTFKPGSEGAPPPPDGKAGTMVVHGEGGNGHALVAFDGAKATARKRQIIGTEAVRKSAALVPRAAKDCLSNDKLAPVESGRGFALLEKMGWKKGQGLGRSNTGAIEPVAAMVKTDMGGLASTEEKYRAPVRVMDADGPQLSDTFSVGVSGMVAQVKAASMDSEFTSIVSQTKSVQQINEENRKLAALAGGAVATRAPTPAPAPPPAPAMPMPPPPMPPPAMPAPAPHAAPPPPHGSYPLPTAGYPQPQHPGYHAMGPPGFGYTPAYPTHMPGYPPMPGYLPMAGYPPMPGFPPMPGHPPMHPQYLSPSMAHQPPPWGWR